MSVSRWKGRKPPTFAQNIGVLGRVIFPLCWRFTRITTISRIKPHSWPNRSRGPLGYAPEWENPESHRAQLFRIRCGVYGGRFGSGARRPLGIFL